MNRLTIFLLFTIGTVFIFLGSGCTQFDYVGQKLTPLNADQPVAFYNSKDEVPPNVYSILGRAVVTAPDGSSSEAVKEELISKAREYGADAIEVVLFKRVKTGEIFLPDKQDPYSGSSVSGSWVTTSNRPDGTPIYTDTFVDTVPLRTHALEQYEIRAKVLFLAEKKKLKNNIEKYKKDRQSYLHGTSRFAQ